MAAGIQEVGAPLDWGPFPDDRWYKMGIWEIEDDVFVTILRKGEQVIYRLQDGEIDVKGRITADDGADDCIRFLSQSNPVRVGAEIRFLAPDQVLQANSRVDATKVITQEMWAVTMVSQMARFESQDPKNVPKQICEHTKMVGGHAYILIEGINDVFRKFFLTVEITTQLNEVQIPHERAVPMIRERIKFEEEWPRSSTLLRSAQKINQMIAHVQEQIAATWAEAQEGRPHIIRFDAYFPNPDENIHNCLSWIIQEAEIMEFRIPLIKLSVVGKQLYVPRYHLDFLDVLCRHKIREGGLAIEDYAKGHGLEELKQLESKLSKMKSDFDKSTVDGSLVFFQCLITPVVGWAALPFVTILFPVFLIGGSIEMHLENRALENKKIELLQLSYEE